MASGSEDLKKQLEDFAGREIGLEAEQFKWLEYACGCRLITPPTAMLHRECFSRGKSAATRPHYWM